MTHITFQYNQSTAESLYGSVLNDAVDCLKRVGISYTPPMPGAGIGELSGSTAGAVGDGGNNFILTLSFLRPELTTDMRYMSDGESICAASGFWSETGRYEILELLG